MPAKGNGGSLKNTVSLDRALDLQTFVLINHVTLFNTTGNLTLEKILKISQIKTEKKKKNQKYQC